MPIDNDVLSHVLPIFSKHSLEDLYIAINDGLISRADVFKACYPKFTPKKNSENVKVFGKDSKK